MSSKVIQFSLWRDSDFAWYEIKGRWTRIPAWLACEWDTDNGGVLGLITNWQNGLMRKFRWQAHEVEALHNIHYEAQSLRLYYSGRFDRHYRNLLGDIHRKVLDLEKCIMFEQPHMRHPDRCEWIAARLNQRVDRVDGKRFVWQVKEYTPNQVGYLLDDIRLALKQDYQRRELRNIGKLARAIQDIQVVEVETENEALERVA